MRSLIAAITISVVVLVGLQISYNSLFRRASCSALSDAQAVSRARSATVHNEGFISRGLSKMQIKDQLNSATIAQIVRWDRSAPIGTTVLFKVANWKEYVVVEISPYCVTQVSFSQQRLNPA
jgi:hypothetical protein